MGNAKRQVLACRVPEIAAFGFTHLHMVSKQPISALLDRTMTWQPTSRVLPLQCKPRDTTEQYGLSGARGDHEHGKCIGHKGWRPQVSPARRCWHAVRYWAVPCIHQAASRAKLRQRDLRLGLETDRRGHMRLVATFGIVGPVLRQLKSIGDRQPGMMIGDRRRHRHLNWSACRAVRNANGACRRACPITLVNSST